MYQFFINYNLIKFIKEKDNNNYSGKKLGKLRLV